MNVKLLIEEKDGEFYGTINEGSDLLVEHSNSEEGLIKKMKQAYGTCKKVSQKSIEFEITKKETTNEKI